MKKEDTATRERIAGLLGASRSVPLEGLPSQGPLDLLTLRRVVHERLQSSGGRPTDPSWSITRSIRFHPDRWKDLEILADALSETDRKVSPGQVASILLEEAVRRAREAMAKEGALPAAVTD